ncbi:hypothetical protein JOF53_002217 [Crossiella equi]|uniref:Uncharacterized protein n=1 Tax=Crossiella equi TaxID=130796 RepID=A0ABS5A9T4_9PSEU|nr:hypothetical protein [Crossiella equi]MBP2473345.1 hypothetical protein [Crossiella equi]
MTSTAPSTKDGNAFPFTAEDPNRLGMVSVDVDLAVGPRREWREITHQRFLMARTDGVVNFLTHHRAPEGERHLPEFEALLGAELGRQHRDDRSAYAELVLDVPLRRGETQVVEWRWLFSACDRPAHRYRGLLRRGTDSLGARLSFHPDALPMRCYHSWSPDPYSTPEQVTDVEIDRTGLGELFVHEARPGWHSIQWEWE